MKPSLRFQQAQLDKKQISYDDVVEDTDLSNEEEVDSNHITSIQNYSQRETS